MVTETASSESAGVAVTPRDTEPPAATVSEVFAIDSVGGSDDPSLSGAVVRNVPFAPSVASWKLALPRLEVWNSRLACWLELFDSCSTPVDAL